MLTVEEIENVSFRRAGFGGYKIEDVDNFVDGVIDRVKDLELSNRELQARIDQLNKKMLKFEEQAGSVQDAIITAEMTSKRIIHDAEIRADAITSDAQSKADAMLREAEESSSRKVSEADIRSQTILDNALLRSASSIDENNRIIEQQKQHIIRIQSEVSRFREALIDSYKNHLRIINSLPKAEEFRQYQEKLDERYPAASPVTPDSLEQEIKDEADRAVEQARAEGTHITVSVLDEQKVREIAEEMRTNSKAQEELEKDREAERKLREIADANVNVDVSDEPDDETVSEEEDVGVIMYRKLNPAGIEQQDSNAEEIMAAASAARTDTDEPKPPSIDEIGDGVIFSSDDEGEGSGEGRNGRQPIRLYDEAEGDGSHPDDIE